jgi:hypothetical protein
MIGPQFRQLPSKALEGDVFALQQAYTHVSENISWIKLNRISRGAIDPGREPLSPR